MNTLTLLLFLAWLVVYWQGGFKILADIRSAFRSGVSRLDAFLLVVLAVLGLGMTITAVWAAWSGVQSAGSRGLAIFGFLLTLTGVIGTFYCRAVYSFAILLYFGLGLAFPFWWNLLAAMGIALGYALKAWDEEKFLEQTLEGYGDYKKRARWRLLPGVC